MKSIKKRSKQLLKSIQQSAHLFYWLGSDIELLSVWQHPAGQIIQACEQLLELSKIMEKWAFIEAMSDSEALNTLSEVAETDFCSQIEDRMFDLVNDHSQSATGTFLQQLLSKLEQQQQQMINDIQSLIDLCNQSF